MSAYPGITMSANGNSTPLLVSLPVNITPMGMGHPAFSLGLVATCSGTANLTYTVQITADQKPTAAGNWNNHDALQSMTASSNSNINYPVTGIRLVVSNYVAGSVNLGVAQWP